MQSKPKPGVGWSWREQAGLPYLVVDAFAQTGLVKHGFSTRHGGMSQDRFARLNLGLHVEDDPEVVWVNRSRFASVLGIVAENMVFPAQVHGTKTDLVTPDLIGSGARDLPSALANADGVICQSVNLPLAILCADCVPVMILDPKQKAIGLAHAGWKGTQQRISEAIIQKMQDCFQTNPKDCLVGIGPAIGPCCFAVGQPVLDQFAKTYTNIQDFIRQYPEENKICLDLWALNRFSLENLGVPEKQIWQADLCTCCQQEQFYSYRGQGGQQTGRMAAVMALCIDRVNGES